MSHEHLKDQNKPLPTQIKTARVGKRCKPISNCNQIKSNNQYTPITLSRKDQLSSGNRWACFGCRAYGSNTMMAQKLQPVLQIQLLTVSQKHYKCIIAKHYKLTGQIIAREDFQILLRERHKCRLLAKESLLIRATTSNMNRTDRRVQLYVYPSGLDFRLIKSAIGDRRSIPPTTDSQATTA
ncbi:unnamed protein product [Didymodactylos carnosus]|uniref:Uncharacterized protein n=1 Tax=Didymodactylos carnosus TaxID=1234261 RepID=A0A8S2CPB4_9BILA|nr:unnamed protein product [Didymodactylos carnosus]CAF3547685.1 unnamed protein product [Didymodactylos carnosus]